MGKWPELTELHKINLITFAVSLYLSCSPRDDCGKYQPPADYLDDLLSSRQSVTDAIGYRLGERVFYSDPPIPGLSDTEFNPRSSRICHKVKMNSSQLVR